MKGQPFYGTRLRTVQYTFTETIEAMGKNQLKYINSG